MTKKYFPLVGFIVLIGGPVVAGERPVVIPPELTTKEKLENAVRQDQAMIENARFESKLLGAQARREEFVKKLAADQAALDAFKTAGPAAYERARLEKEIANARFESKLLSQQLRIDAAEKKLAELSE